MKAFAYLRVSGAAQVEGDGFDRQLLTCARGASADGISQLCVYREEGVSGAKDLENRPALLHLLQDIEDTGIHVVYIERLDRLARDLMVQETILADFKKRGIQLLSVVEPDLCSDDPSRKLMRQIFGAIAEYDRSMIVLKLRGARQRKKTREGRCEGRKPFGHYDGEAPILAEMRRLRASGLQYHQIAEALASRGISARSGGIWRGPVIAKILRRDLVTQ